MSKNINNIKIISNEEEYIPEVIREIDDFDSINQEVLKEINKARQSPEEYALILEDILKRIKEKNDNCLFLDNIPFIYNDLYDSLKDSINYLKSQKKLPNLEYNKSISYSCEDLLYEYVNDPNYKNSNINYESRINQYGQPIGENYEIINYDISDAEFLVINLILCDGDKSKFERKVIFNPNLKYIGIISGIIPPNKYCIIINCCEDFYENDKNIPIEMKNKFKTQKNIYNTKTVISKKSDTIPEEIKNIDNNKNYKISKKEKEKEKENKHKINEDKNNQNKNNNIILRNPPNKIVLKDMFDYDLENFDEEEFFEKEFDTNYGKYEKDKNSHKKMFSTTSTIENGVQKTIITKLVENVDKNGIKRGYFIEKEENKENKGNKYNKNEYIEKEKRDMKILKDMERKEKERIQNENKKKRIKEIPIKLKGKKGENDDREYLEEDNTMNYEEENNNLPEGAVDMQIQQKTITDSNGEPVLEITKTITYEDGSVQKIVDKLPLEAFENE